MSSSTARRRPPGSSSPPSASPSITFTTTPSILRDIMSNRDTGQQAASFYDALHSHPERGIQNNAEQLANRQAVFGVNVIAPKKPKSIFKLALNAALDVSLIILQLAALISFVLAFVAPPEEAGPEGKPAVSESHANWIEGVAIMVSVFLVIIITAWNDWKKETQFQALKDRIDKEVKCSVVRDGISMEILVSELVVGDVCQIKYGDLIPADGLLIASNDLLLDESSLTGESDHVKKDPVNSPLIYSGTHVMEGSGRMLIVAVGVNSQAGIIMKLLGAAGLSKAEKAAEKVAKKKKVEAGKVKIKSKGAGDIEMQSLGGDDDRMEEVPLDEEHRTGGMDEVEQAKGTEKSVLQTKLTKLSGQIGYIGMSIAILTVLVLWSRFSYDTYITAGQSFLTAHLNYFVKYFIIGITVLVVAIPEGLPLAVTISLACSVQRMTKDNNLVRHLDACETMGNATTICSDKTGTLTTNRMKVMEAWTLDTSFRGKQLATALKKNSGDETRMLTRKLAEAIVYNCADTSKIVPAQITAQNGSSSSSSARQAEQLGNKTECALLGFVDDDLGFSYEELRRHAPQQVKVYTFNSARKSMSTVVSRAGGEFVVYTKGASEIILNKCRYYLDASGTPQLITDAKRDQLLAEVINPMADDALRSIAIAAKEYVKPSKSAGRPARNVEQMFGGAEPNWDDEEHVVDDLTLLAVIGIEDPVRDEVPEAIRNCQQAGITVRMVTGDNLNTARSIATRCGILRPDEDFLVLDSARFNELIRDPTTGRVSQKRFDTVWPRLRVLARSSPADKYILVKHIVASKLHPNREVVAVTGDGTNDAPALKKADVGFAMGIAGTDVAKEAADIIITDDNFSSIVKSVMWGRNVYDCIAKFLQFQLTVNVVAVVVAFAGAAMIEDSPLKAVQMLWVNLIMDSFASVAMAYEALSPDLLNRPPYGRKRALISPRMWLNIVGHSVYQLVLIFTILFWGPEFLGIESGINRGPLAGPSQHFSFIFNAFVLMTIFNEVNCRKLHGQRNVFAGITQNPMFCLIIILSLLVQVVIFLIPLCRNIFNIAPLSFSQWMWCLVLGASVLVWNQILITIPIEQLYPDWREDSAGTKTVPPPPSEETADKTKVAPEDATAPSDKISAPASSRRAQAAAAATIPGAIDEDEEEDEEEDSGTSSTTSTRVLWLRGFLRLQQQLRVVNAFQAELKRRPTPDAARMAYAHQRQLITSQESKEGKDVPVAFV